eukprot:815532-Amphidinium_carterae.1
MSKSIHAIGHNIRSYVLSQLTLNVECVLCQSFYVSLLHFVKRCHHKGHSQKGCTLTYQQSTENNAK